MNSWEVFSNPSICFIKRPCLDFGSYSVSTACLQSQIDSGEHQEISAILTDKEYCKNQRIRPSSVDLLLKAKSSISTISSYSLTTHCRRDNQKTIKRHDNWLKELTVQNKILEVAELEDSNQVWKRFLQGLPAGQLSFLLRATTDTLPTPLNVGHWRLKSDPSCSLCGHKQPTIHHILSNCSEAFQQGRYTWRHDSAHHHWANHSPQLHGESF